MAENIVESIIVKLGLDGSQYNQEADKAVKKNQTLNKSVGETDKVVGAVTKTVAKWFSALAVATGVAKMIDEVQKLNEELFHLEKNLGMSSQTIKNWQGAAGAMGGSAQGMTESIKTLNMGMNDFVMMGDTSLLPFFNALGVSMVDANGKLKETDAVMLDLADSFSEMDREQAFSIASKMGIDEGTFNTLVQGRKEMEKMLEYQSKMYKSSEEELKASRALAQNRALLGQHWESLKTMMANAIIPLFVKLSEVALSIFEYLQENQQAVQAVFKGISFVVGAILIPILAKATVAALAFMAPFLPFIAVVGALGAAFGLLYDDYKTWAEGGKSLFDWGAFATYIDNAKFSTDNLKNSFAYLLTGYKDWASAAEGGKEWLKLKGFIEDNNVSVGSLTNGFKNLARELMSDVIPTLKGYGSILSKLFSGDFRGAVSEAKEMGLEYWKRATASGNAMGERLRGALDIATGQEVGTASSIDIVNRGGNKYLLDLIAKGEVGTTGKEGYNTAYRGSRVSAQKMFGKDLSELTIGQVKQLQKASLREQASRGIPASKRSSAMGRYQFINTGFDDYINAAGLSDNDKFSPENQDAMAMAILRKGRYGLDAVKAGKATTKQFQDNVLAARWASIKMSNGRGRYDGDGINMASHGSSAEIQKAIRQTDVLAAGAATTGRSSAVSTNKTDVHIGEVKIQTSSSTMTGTGQDLANGVQDQWSMFQNAVR